jgi:hypothetical protein
MARIHFICRNHLGVIPTKFPEFESGSWDIPEVDAKTLLGGTIFLHETKSSPSYFGGTISHYRVVEIDQAHSNRIVFTLTSTKEARGIDWEGIDHAMAWSGGVLT